MATLIQVALLMISASAIAQTGNFGSTADLFGQTAQAALRMQSSATDFPNVSWLLMDVRTGQLLASRWPDASEPIPVGSLTKPFVALAYANTHSTFPHYTCKGSSERCWLSQGHGELNVEQALAHSCNAYFLQLAKATDPAAMERVVLDYGLSAPQDAARPAALIGLDPDWRTDWRISPLALSRAYARLALQPASAPTLDGMRLAAIHGTASALHSEDALAKTGTARCVQDCVASGDGFVVALTPARDPRLLLLVRERGTTGAVAALTAARMLRCLREHLVIQ